MSAPPPSTAAVSLRGITKRYPRVLANDRVDLDVARGEVHALVGENGAGKSTLVKVLFGLEKPDEGEIRIDGRPVRLRGPRDAIALGLGMVHQHFMLVPTLTGAENVVLGAEPGRAHGLLLDRRAAVDTVARLAEEHGLRVDPSARVEDLGLGEQQRVEILKVLYRGARVLILDEPTAVLTPQEVDELLETLRRLRAAGRSVVFITHKLREVLAVADRTTVLRRGAVAGVLAAQETSAEKLAELMVGRPVLLSVDRRDARPGEVVLSVSGLSAVSSRGAPALEQVSFELRAGEVLGIAGVEGNGQTELVHVLSGLLAPTSGTVALLGADVTRARPRAMPAGIVPEDRHRHAAVLDMTLAENALLGWQRDPRFSSPLRLRARAVEGFARELCLALDVRPADPDAPFRALSGGNQQKLVVARELARAPRLLIVAQPTRGVDIGATEAIHRKVLEARDGGAAVLLISAELSEVLSLSDRIAVIAGGRIQKILEARGADEREVGLLMGHAGVRA